MHGKAWKFSANETEARIEVGRTTIKSQEAFNVCNNSAGFDMKCADQLFGAL